jgi:protein SCO1
VGGGLPSLQALAALAQSKAARYASTTCFKKGKTMLRAEGRRKIGLTVAAAACFAMSAAVWRAADNSHWGADYFPNVRLTTQDGRVVRFYDDLMKGKKVAIYLMYTTCKYSCPLETARMAQVQRYLGDAVGKDIFFYSISIDPKHDTPEAMKSYAAKYHAGPGWLFLTGKPEDINKISKRLGLYAEPDPANQDGHVPSLMIGNVSTGQWMKNSALDNPRFLAITIAQFLGITANGSQTAMKTIAEARPINFERGQYVFGTKCAPCHTVGHGDTVGPDLLGVTALHDHGWLTQFVSRPDQMLAAGDATAKALFAKYKQVQMPNLGLGSEDVEAVLAYLDRKVLYYSCPMHPETRSDKPGKAPCCGMRLEPVFTPAAQ